MGSLFGSTRVELGRIDRIDDLEGKSRISATVPRYLGQIEKIDLESSP